MNTSNSVIFSLSEGVFLQDIFPVCHGLIPLLYQIIIRL